MNYQEQPQDTYESINGEYSQQSAEADALQIRLNSDSIKARLQVYLLGMTEKYSYDEEGNIQRTIQKSGYPKVNDIGLQAVMMHVESVINPQTVQGNFDDTRYSEYLRRFREEFSKDLWINMAKYGIDSDDYDGIIAAIMRFIEPFMSRTINDGERKSYSQSLKSEIRNVGGKQNPGLLNKIFG
jgi:hypothetical protein